MKDSAGIFLIILWHENYTFRLGFVELLFD